jgi:CRP-like cAMP-binding protein
MTEILAKSFLFRGLDIKTVSHIIKEISPQQKTYKRNDLIYPSPNDKEAVGFVIQGKCEIRKPRSDSGKTVINILSPGDSFGILSVFSDEEFPTEIYASVNCSILFFSKEQIISFVNNYSQISTNIITFLADRVNFLNRKIATFSAKSVESKLAAFILDECERQSSDTITFNAKKTSEEIGAGRASVYRALASLQDSGLIIFTNKQTTIINKTDLERI